MEKQAGISYEKKTSSLTIKVVYDNNEYDKNFSTGFGFASLAELDNCTILFDTGGDSPTLLNNTEKMNIAPEDIDAIVLSHIHSDHVGGLLGLLELTKENVTVYVPASFPADFKNQIREKAELVEVKESAEICGGAYSTGELGIGIKEQSLMIRTDKGLVVITGCAHPGIVNIIKEAKTLTNNSIHLVLGGFHLSGEPDSKLNEIVQDFRELGVEKAAPCHCTGNRAIQLFKEEYGENFIQNGVGKTIEIQG